MPLTKDLKSKDKKSEAAQDSEELDGPPPPPYSAHDAEPPSRSQPTSAAYPPQAHHTQVPSRVLAVEYTKWTLQRLGIRDAATSEELYEGSLKWLKSVMTFTKPGSSDPFATVHFHTVRQRWDINFAERPTLNIHLHKKWKHSETAYHSPALQGAKLTWKSFSHFKTWDIECRDEQGVLICRGQANMLNFKKAGKIEFFGDVAGSNADLMDELVVNGIAMLEYLAGANSIVPASVT